MPLRLIRADAFHLQWIFCFKNHYFIHLSPWDGKCRPGLACADCAGWSGSILYAGTIMMVFSRNGSYVLTNVVIFLKMKIHINVIYQRSILVKIHFNVIVNICVQRSGQHSRVTPVESVPDYNLSVSIAHIFLIIWGMILIVFSTLFLQLTFLFSMFLMAFLNPDMFYYCNICTSRKRVAIVWLITLFEFKADKFSVISRRQVHLTINFHAFPHQNSLQLSLKATGYLLIYNTI